MRRKSSQHRVESAETLKVGESQETLATDPALQRATTCEQALATPCGTPTPAPTGSAKDMPKIRKNRLRKMKTHDVEPEQSPVNEKALPLYPADRSPAKRPKKAKAKAKASQVLKRPAMAITAPGSSKVTGGGSGVLMPKAKPKAKVKTKANPKPASRKRKQPDEDQDEDEEEEQETEGNGDEEPGETEQNDISDKAKIAHKLYMRFWRDLRSQGLNTSAVSLL